MEIDSLPEELLKTVISLSRPQDACHTAGVSRAFRAAADSDTVWSRFLPHELPRLAKKELPSMPLSKKGLFQRLSTQPALLPTKFVVCSNPSVCLPILLDCSLNLRWWVCVLAEYATKQGNRRQVLHNFSKGASDFVGKQAAQHVLDECQG
jgi:hypothetical protein